MFNAVNLLSAEGGSNWLIWVILIALLLVMLIMPMFTNRKKQKEVNEMFDTLGVGDEIMTIGGIMGKVVELKTHESGEKLMVIETGEGANKMTMTFTVQALRLNYTKTKLRQEQLAKEKAEREAAKNKKNEGAKNESANEDLPLEVVSDTTEQAEQTEAPQEAEAQAPATETEVKEKPEN